MEDEDLLVETPEVTPGTEIEPDAFDLAPGAPVDLDDQSAVDAVLASAGARQAPTTLADVDVAPPPGAPAPAPAIALDEDEVLTAPAPAIALDEEARALVPVLAADDVDEEALRAAPPALAGGDIDDLDLAPDFRRVDFARALDRLAEPRIDPTGAAQAAADAERTLRDLEVRQATLQTAVVDGERELRASEEAAAAAASLPPGPERDAALGAAAARRERVDADLLASRAAYQAVGGEVRRAREGRQAARAAYQEDLAAWQREGEVLAAAAETAAAGAAASEDERILRESKARDAELAREGAAAEKQLAADRRAYREALERGPEADGRAVALSVASVIGEALMARAAGRPPDFARAIEPALAATREQFQNRLRARLDAVEEAGDAVARAARAREVHRAETAAQRAESLAAIERQLDGRVAAARGTGQEAQLLAVRDDARAAREAAEAEALAANAKLARQRQRDDVELDELQAKARKARADATLAERKARGGSGGGLGRGRSSLTVDPSLAALKPEERKTVEERGVRDPVSGAWLRTDEGGYVLTSDAKTATSLRDQLGAMRDYTALSNKLADLVAEHGVEPKSWRGEVRQEMDAIVADLQLITKNAEQTGALDKGSVEVIMQKIAGGVDPGDFGASAEIILKGAERMQNRFSSRVRDLSVTGRPRPMAFPDARAQRGEIEKNARAGEEARRLAGTSDVAGTPTAGDPLGEADGEDKFARFVRGNAQLSERALAAARSLAEGRAITLPGGIETVIPPQRAERLRGLATRIDEGDTSPEVRDEFEAEARRVGLLGDKNDFILPGDKDAEIERARASERRADAVRAANWLIQNQADPRRVDLGYLRKIGVVKGEYAAADRGALGADIADAYKRYTAPAEAAEEAE